MKIVFMGTPRAAVSTLDQLLQDGHQIAAVYTQPDRPAGRGNNIVASPVKEFAVGHDLPVIQPQKIRTRESIEEFAAHNADVAVVVAYGRILPEPYLTAFPLGAINVHFSLLPKYRGAAPVNWAIANGETETGVTTMKMDVGLDTGDILVQKSADIGRDETAIELMERLSQLGALALSETLVGIGGIEPKEQVHELATYAPILKKEDGVIDWGQTASAISNRVRGFQPFPTTFTHLGGTRLTIWRATPLSDPQERTGDPGEILRADGGQILVGCGGGTVLSVDELQLEGKRRLSVRDFLNGARVREGDILGKQA